MSLELIEKSLGEIKDELTLLRRNQLLMLKMWIRILFQDKIPMELVKLMADLEERITAYDQILQVGKV